MPLDCYFCETQHAIRTGNNGVVPNTIADLPRLSAKWTFSFNRICPPNCYFG